MKKLLIAFIAVFSLTLTAQDKLTEGKIVSKQTLSSDNEQLMQQLAMMGDMQTTTYFKDKKSRTELSNPMSGDVVTISNTETNEFLTLMDNPMMGKKYTYVKNDKAEEMSKNIEVKAGEETKEILGYKCKQYFVSIDQDGVQMTMEIFTTEAIPVASQQTSMLGDKLKGFPLYMVMDMNQMGNKMKITTEVTQIEKQSVSDDQFSMTPPEGYENMEGQN
ncbi:hypothetical protein [uncultured Psychroserpens sp.]|uniref:hypothetical protein n=1 Tax=uncultured Psychroserpens sp. TaxID=255436 RepID=UPI002632F60D|nr:hypothetical protein [uncultured Psychroserpens sp.]